MDSPLLRKSEPSESLADPNLQRLIWLRTITTIGSIGCLMLVWYRYDLLMPVGPLAAVAIILMVINGATWWRLRNPRIVTEAEFFGQVLVDVATLSGVLYLTGGAVNPFALFFLLPLTVAATVLPRTYAWATAMITVACYTFLLFFHLPVPELLPSADHTIFELHVSGMWLGFVLIAVLVAYFIVGMAETLRERDRKLARAREQALRDERIIALGTLAAGAAHELSTPLATMAVITRELENEYPCPEFTLLHDQLGIMQTQIDRCREALSVMSASAGATRAETATAIRLDTYVTDIIEQLRTLRRIADPELTVSGPKPAPQVVIERTLTQAILNVLHNSVDVSPDDIQVVAHWDEMELAIECKDRGGGIAGAPHASNCQPVVSTKRNGMGLGLFLSHTVIHNMGGSIRQRNRAGGGTATMIRLPLKELRVEVAR